MRRGNAVSCAKCGHAFMEAWPWERYAIRCGNEKSGQWRGRVTELFRAGQSATIAFRPPAGVVPEAKEGKSEQ